MTAAFDFSVCLSSLLFYFMLQRLGRRMMQKYLDCKTNNLLLFLIHNAKAKGTKQQFPGNQISKPIPEAGGEEGNQPCS